MKPIVNLSECLQDSPKFREIIEETEDEVDLLEQKLEKLVKLCSSMVECGKAFITSKNGFINGIWDLVGCFKDDVTVVGALNRLIQALTELMKYQSILIDQEQRSVVTNLNNFVKNDIRQTKETKKYFEKMSDELDSALIRNSQVPRSKAHECEETNNILTAVRSCFRHTALDYIFQLSSLQSKKRFEVLDTLLSLMHAYSTYFHQGSDLFQDFDPFLKQLANSLNEIKEETSELEKQLENRHTLVTPYDTVPVLLRNLNSDNGVKLEGYLFKRTSNAFKTWNRRWFIIQNNQLVYRKRTRGDALTVMEEDLRLCTAKPAPDLDRRFCFEVLSPSKSHMLQADSEETYQRWITAMHAGINAALHHTLNETPVEKQDRRSESGLSSSSDSSHASCNSATPPPPKPPRAHNQLLSIPGNSICADCNSSEPQWASINLGITLCIECSGIHRGLGVHVSKVRSLMLDAWEPELLKVMAELGNSVVNNIYESCVNEKIAVRAAPDSPRNVREEWIKAKYLKKAFVKPLPIYEEENANVVGENEHIEKMVRNTARRWSVRKVNRRRRTTYNSGEIKTDNPPHSTSLKVAEKRRDSLPSLSIVQNSTSISQQPEPTEGVSEEKNSDIEQVKESISKNVPANKEEIIIFGDIVEQEIQNASIDLDSADESPNADDDSDEVTSEDISKLHPDLLLYKAAVAHNLPVMCEALAHGANPNWPNPDDDGKYSLHQAIRSGSIMACEYLLLNGAKGNNQDYNGRSTLHLATEMGHIGQVCLLLKRGVDQTALDQTGKDALSIAVDEANADIVTVLRLAKLNEEMRRDDFGNPGDETFNEVVKDFTHMASNNPEKLRRPPSEFHSDSSAS